MVMLAEPELQSPVTATVYVVVPVGTATGLWQFVQLNPVAGLQAYVLELLTFNVVVSPRQSVEKVAVTVGVVTLICSTVTVTSAVPAAHPPVVVTVYVVVVAGDATGLAQVVQLNPLAGLHEKLFPELTCSTDESPMQIVAGVAVAVGAELTAK